jgi:hypothetical protein
MPDPPRSPGPAADRAFALGLRGTVVGVLLGIGLLYLAGVLTARDAVLAVVLGAPVAIILASCVLGVWLGYSKDALDVALSR